MSVPITKIIILLDLPLDNRLFNVFGVNTLIYNGFDVEIWDLTPFFHKEFQDRIVIDGQVVFEQCKKFDNKRDIALALSKISPNTIVNSFISYQYQTFFIYHLLSKNNVKYCVVQMISFPNFPSPQKGASFDFFHITY